MLRPQGAKALEYEGSRETPSNQIHVETACPLAGRIPLPAAPVAARRAIQHVALGDLGEGLGDAGLQRAARDPLALQLLAQPVAAQTVVQQARARVARREAPVVEVALLAQPLQGRVDLAGAEALAQQAAPQLSGRVVAAREPLEGALVGRLR
jgi:hypothetical protein